MLSQILDDLTQEQKRALDDLGVPHSRRSEWKHGKKRPTYRQALSLAQVTGCDLKELLAEIAMLDATPEQKTYFQHVMAGYTTPALLAILATLAMMLTSTQALANIKDFGANVHSQMIDHAHNVESISYGEKRPRAASRHASGRVPSGSGLRRLLASCGFTMDVAAEFLSVAPKTVHS